MSAPTFFGDDDLGFNFGRFIAWVKTIPPFERERFDEERLLGVQLAQGASEDERRAAGRRLVEASIRLAISRAKIIRREKLANWAKSHPRGTSDLVIDMEEACQVALIGLLEARLRFDPQRGRFTSYARFWIDKRLRLFVSERWKLQDRECAWPVQESDTGEVEQVDKPDRNTPFPAESELEALAIATLRETARLNDRTRYVLRRDAEGATDREIAAELCLSHTRVRQIVDEARSAAHTWTPRFKPHTPRPPRTSALGTHMTHSEWVAWKKRGAERRASEEAARQRRLQEVWDAQHACLPADEESAA
jgi:RNA polymerase sigma factor (sigma-70 family)